VITCSRVEAKCIYLVIYRAQPDVARATHNNQQPTSNNNRQSRTHNPQLNANEHFSCMSIMTLIMCTSWWGNDQLPFPKTPYIFTSLSLLHTHSLSLALSLSLSLSLKLWLLLWLCVMLIGICSIRRCGNPGQQGQVHTIPGLPAD